MFSFFPPVFRRNRPNPDSNGRSTMFAITMFANPESTGAVLAQEMREFGIKTKWLHLPSLVIAALLSYFYGINGAVGGLFVIILAVLAMTIFSPLERMLELRGHETETQAAALLYGDDPVAYRLREAYGMARHYGCFKNWSVEDVEKGMRRQTASSLRYVKRHEKKLRAFDRKYPLKS